MTPHWIEPCAGSGAVGLALHGFQPLCSYTGSKGRWAPEILALAGYRPSTRRLPLLLGDAGPWGDCWHQLAILPLQLYRRMEQLVEEARRDGPQAVWDRLVDETPPAGWSSVDGIAAWLYVQALSFRRAPVVVRAGMLAAPRIGRPGEWLSRPGWGGYGIREAVLLSRRLWVLADRIHWDREAISSSSGCWTAERLISPLDDLSGSVVYLDPPYQGTTGYAADLPREEVLALARRWRGQGALVMVSEAEPLEELVAEGWHQVDLTDGSQTGGNLGRIRTEWVTMSAPPAQTPARQMGLWR